jgi:hypothetical protein
MDSARAGRDRGQHDVAGRHRKVTGVVLADPEEVHADLVRKHALLDHIADRLRVRVRVILPIVC